MFRPSLLLPLSLLLAACTPSVYQEGPSLGENPDLLGPNITEEIRAGEFFVGPGDKIEIKVFTEPNYNRTVQVYSDGTAPFPQIGKVRVSGLTRLQLRDRLEEEYSHYLVDATLDVTLSLNTLRKVTVLGEVARTGMYPMHYPRLTILDIVAEAGGITGDGDKTGVLIMRRVDGQPQIAAYDLDLLWQPSDPRIRTEIPFVHPGDVVYVVRTWLAEYLEAMEAIKETLKSVILLERAIIGAGRVDIAIS